MCYRKRSTFEQILKSATNDAAAFLTEELNGSFQDMFVIILLNFGITILLYQNNPALNGVRSKVICNRLEILTLIWSRKSIPVSEAN